MAFGHEQENLCSVKILRRTVICHLLGVLKLSALVFDFVIIINIYFEIRGTGKNGKLMK